LLIFHQVIKTSYLWTHFGVRRSADAVIEVYRINSKAEQIVTGQNLCLCTGWPWAEFEFSAWGASWRTWRAGLARASGSLRAEPSVGSRGKAQGKAPGQGVWGTQSPRS